jgi:hypothetical protein
MFKRVSSWIHALVSEPDGTPSSTRVLMFAFSAFSMHLIWRCFAHILALTDPVQISTWLSNMPMLITSLIALIALPYGINKGTATFSDIANMMTAAKGKKVSK